jgi:FtsZ-interacting cell division protein YlmF
MNIFEKFKNGISGNNTDDTVNAFEGYDTYEDDAYDSNDGAMAMSSASLQLKVVKPSSYDEVTSIADHLLEGKTVVLNLEKTNKESARRLIDFLTGVVYSVQGKFKNVAANTFIITPHDVDVTGDPATLTEAEEEAEEE